MLRKYVFVYKMAAEGSVTAYHVCTTSKYNTYTNPHKGAGTRTQPKTLAQAIGVIDFIMIHH